MFWNNLKLMCGGQVNIIYTILTKTTQFGMITSQEMNFLWCDQWLCFLSLDPWATTGPHRSVRGKCQPILVATRHTSKMEHTLKLMQSSCVQVKKHSKLVWRHLWMVPKESDMNDINQIFFGVHTRHRQFFYFDDYFDRMTTSTDLKCYFLCIM